MTRAQTLSPADDPSLASGDETAWRARALAALKGAPFDKLISTSPDGIAIQPLYARAEGDSPRALRAEAGPWAIAQRVDHPDPAAANALALEDLAGGADALALVTAGAPSAYGCGLKVADGGDLAVALENIHLDLISLRLDAGADALRVASLLARLTERRKLDPAQLRIDWGFDPFGPLACAGGLDMPLADWLRRAASLASDFRARGFDTPAFLADGRAFHEAGATDAQELGIALAAGVAFMRAMEAQGLSLQSAAAQVACLLCADADQFLGLAKFRAARRLFARLHDSCGLAPQPLSLHAQTSFRMTARLDPHVNILRAATATFAAGLGGADAICALPFTAALGLPDAFARRVVRNSQHVLLQESHLAKVADPAAGSGAYEGLTAGLCEKAWAFFQSIEALGGLAAALAGGQLQRDIGAAQAARRARLATRRTPITGVSEFPELGQAAAATLDIAPSPASAPRPAHGECPPLARARDAEPFEALRARPPADPVHIAALGPLADHAARAAFVENALAVGGLRCVRVEAVDDAALAAIAAAARLVIVCGSDAAYGERGVPAVHALRAAGAGAIWLAGRPRALEAELRAAGISEFLAVGADLELLLAAAQSALTRPAGG